MRERAPPRPCMLTDIYKQIFNLLLVLSSEHRPVHQLLNVYARYLVASELRGLCPRTPAGKVSESVDVHTSWR